MKNKNILYKIKKKLIILGLLTSLSTPIIPNRVCKAEESNNIEINNDTYEENEDITSIITYYSNVYGIEESYIYDAIDSLTLENDDEIEINKNFIENLSKDIYYNSTKYGYKFINITKDNEKSIKELVTYYSNVFGIEESSIYDMIDYKMNESEDEFVIDELAILNITRDLYNNGNYNLKKESVSSISLAPEYMVEKYANLIGVNKEVAMSIIYAECGSAVNSSNYLNSNNPAGIGPNMHFLNKEVGIIYFINMLKNSYGCTLETNSTFFSSIASKYCENPDHWISLCSGSYNSIVNNYYSHRPDYIKEEDKTLKLY